MTGQYCDAAEYFYDTSETVSYSPIILQSHNPTILRSYNPTISSGSLKAGSTMICSVACSEKRSPTMLVL